MKDVVRRGYDRLSRTSLIDRVRELVTGAEFVRADATAVDFPAGSVDAVTSVPR